MNGTQGTKRVLNKLFFLHQIMLDPPGSEHFKNQTPVQAKTTVHKHEEKIKTTSKKPAKKNATHV